MIKIVHISDIHIHDRETNLAAIAGGIQGFLKKASPVQKGLHILSKGISALSAAKRMGYAIKEDRPDIRKILLEDIDREQPDHVIISGDITNTALEKECEEARRCFERFIPGRRLSIVPGNHDYPVFMEQTARITDYFTDAFPNGKVTFPFVKLLGGELAVIGLNSCLEIFDFLSNPEVVVHTARGKLHRDQLNALSSALADPRMEGRYKIVVLHHHVLEPPDRGRGTVNKAHDYFMEKAANSDYLLDLLKANGVGMVLHGHRHIRQITSVEGLTVIGAGSAIHPEPSHEPLPSFYIYEFGEDAPKISVKALDGDRYRILRDERFLPRPGKLACWRYE